MVMEPHIATIVEFCYSSKKIWDSIAESFSHQSNVTQVYEIYEKLFPTMQSGKPLYEYYSTLKFMGAVITVASYHKFGTTEVIL